MLTLAPRHVACCTSVKYASRHRPSRLPPASAHIPPHATEGCQRAAVCEARNLLLISLRSSRSGATGTQHRRGRPSSVVRAVAEHGCLVGSAMGQAAFSWRVTVKDKRRSGLGAVGGRQGGLWVFSAVRRSARAAQDALSRSGPGQGGATRGWAGCGPRGEGARGRGRRGGVEEGVATCPR